MIFLNLGAALLLASLSVQGATDYSIALTNPKPGEELRYYSWEVALVVEVVAPPGDYEVELSYQGVTHHLPALAARGRPGEGGKASWSLRDPWLLPELGTHELELRLLSLTDAGLGASGRMLADSTVPLTYAIWAEKPPQMAAGERMLNLARNALVHAEVLDPVKDPYRDTNVSDLDHQRALAVKWLAARSEWLQRRVEVLTEIAELYEYTGRPGDGLRALRRAEAIWNAESPEILHRAPAPAHPAKWIPNKFSSAPPHTLALANFYARRMEFDRAMEYLQAALTYMTEQQAKHPSLDEGDRRNCANHSSTLMTRIAELHYLLRRDRAGYDLWMTRAEKARAPARDGGGGLLGH